MTDRPNPVTSEHQDGFAEQEQNPPGLTAPMHPTPDHGERSYRGSGRLEGAAALITGGDSGIGRAVAIAFAREGADVAFTHLPEEHDDAAETSRLVEEAGRSALAMPGDLRDPEHSAVIVTKTVERFGRLDVLVLNAAHQRARESFRALTLETIDATLRTNLVSPMLTVQAALDHLRPGGSIIFTSSIQAVQPSPDLVDYAITKTALVGLTKALAEELGPEGIRVNAVAPGPIWTPLIPATGWGEGKLPSFGQDTPIGRAGQPAELAGAYVYLASDAASYVTGAVIPVTGGRVF